MCIPHPVPVYSVSCVLPAPPLNGALINTECHNTNPIKGSVITFQCYPAFSLVGAENSACNNSGLWDPDPALLECISISRTYIYTHCKYSKLADAICSLIYRSHWIVYSYSCCMHVYIGTPYIFRSSFGLLPPTVQSPILFTGEVLFVSVAVTAVAFIAIGFFTGLLVMHFCYRLLRSQCTPRQLKSKLT